jgi:hypothetical protein
MRLMERVRRRRSKAVKRMRFVVGDGKRTGNKGNLYFGGFLA